MQQVRQPDLSVKDYPGYCLRFVRKAFDIGPKYAYAWQSWENSKTQHTGALPTDVAVPVYFTWRGTINGVTRNWGDVAIHVPGKGVLATPLRYGGWSQQWFGSVKERAQAIGGGAQYVGWTADVNGVQVVKGEPDRPGHRYAHLVDKTVKLHPKVNRWRVYHPGTNNIAGDVLNVPGADGLYIVRGVSQSRPNRVVINSKALGNGLELPLADAAGNEYVGEWSVL